jgi:hypothetical protein
MRKMHVVLLVIGVVVVVGVGAGWLFCAQGWKSLATSYSDDIAVAAAIEEVRVEGGTVEVVLRPGSGPGVQLHRTARYLSPLHAQPGVTHRIEGTVLVLGGDPDGGLSVVEYIADVPAGVRVVADVGTGLLDLTGVSTVKAKVGTGSVKVVGATGDVVVRTGTGAVSVDLAVPADVDAQVDTGGVDVTVPSDAYRVEASSAMGEVKVGVPNDPTAPHRLSLRTKMGRVSVATR